VRIWGLKTSAFSLTKCGADPLWLVHWLSSDSPRCGMSLVEGVKKDPGIACRDHQLVLYPEIHIWFLAGATWSV
jgi:hypothetical protein